MKIISEVIDEYCNKIISEKRKKIDFINENYNIRFAKNKHKELSKCINDINRLNEALKNIEDSLKTIEDIEHNH